MLLVATEERQRLLAEGLADGFEVERSTDIRTALEFLARCDVDALLLHLDLGQADVIALLGQLERRTIGRVPGVIVVARELDTRTVVAVVRAGAFDVVLEGSMQPRELAHLVRNAAFSAQATAQLGTSRAHEPKQVVVVGSGDGVEAIVLLLEASGLCVRHVTRVSQAGGAANHARTIVVDLSVVGSGEELVRLLAHMVPQAGPWRRVTRTSSLRSNAISGRNLLA